MNFQGGQIGQQQTAPKAAAAAGAGAGSFVNGHQLAVDP